MMMNRNKFRDKHPDEYAAFRRKVLTAFKSLRPEGIRTRANYWCCSSCACAASTVLDEKLEKAKKPVPWGFVYWHKQDDDALRSDGELHIRYCTPDGKATKALGYRVFVALQKEGLDPEWDGDPSKTIQLKVSVPEPVTA